MSAQIRKVISLYLITGVIVTFAILFTAVAAWSVESGSDAGYISDSQVSETLTEMNQSYQSSLSLVLMKSPRAQTINAKDFLTEDKLPKEKGDGSFNKKVLIAIGSDYENDEELKKTSMNDLTALLSDESKFFPYFIGDQRKILNGGSSVGKTFIETDLKDAVGLASSVIVFLEARGSLFNSNGNNNIGFHLESTKNEKNEKEGKEETEEKEGTEGKESANEVCLKEFIYIDGSCTPKFGDAFADKDIYLFNGSFPSKIARPQVGNGPNTLIYDVIDETVLQKSEEWSIYSGKSKIVTMLSDLASKAEADCASIDLDGNFLITLNEAMTFWGEAPQVTGDFDDYAMEVNSPYDWSGFAFGENIIEKEDGKTLFGHSKSESYNESYKNTQNGLNYVVVYSPESTKTCKHEIKEIDKIDAIDTIAQAL